MAFNKQKYDQQYVKSNYDRIPINVKKGDKDKILEYAKRKGFNSINEYVKFLIYSDMEDDKKNKNIKIKNVTKNGGQNIINIE